MTAKNPNSLLRLVGLTLTTVMFFFVADSPSKDQSLVILASPAELSQELENEIVKMNQLSSDAREAIAACDKERFDAAISALEDLDVNAEAVLTNLFETEDQMNERYEELRTQRGAAPTHYLAADFKNLM